MTGRLADLIRLFWGLIYWNTRKSLFRMRSGRGRCPCQSPSDSGRAFETACEASLTWDRQERFHRVCPLLKRNPAGHLSCSVNTTDVRPFWGRALLLAGGSALALYLTVTIAAFGLLRGIGYPVTYRMVAWPPLWSQRDHVRSEFFATKARRALEHHDRAEAFIAYSIAYQYDPSNLSAGLALAQLAQISQPALADQLYAQLLRTHPERRAALLTSWYNGMLLRADFRSIVPLAVEGLKKDPEHLSAWLHALLFALAREPSPSALRSLADDSSLPPEARTVLALELRSLTAPREEMRQTLLRPPTSSFAYLDFYRPSKLADLGFTGEALFLLNQHSTLNPRDLALLVLHASALRGGTPAVRGHFNGILGESPPPSILELLAVHLVSHPDRELTAALLAAAAKHPALSNPADPATIPVRAAFVAAAGASGDDTLLSTATQSLRNAAGGDARTTDAIASFFRSAKPDMRIESILPLLPGQSAEMTCALLARYHRPRPAPTGPKSTPTRSQLPTPPSGSQLSTLSSQPSASPTPAPSRSPSRSP